MPDIEGILKNLGTLLQLAYGKGHVPGWTSTIIGWSLLVFCLFWGLWSLLALFSKIKELWVKDFQPLFYNAELKHRQKRRRRFAEHIDYELRSLSLQEDWQDDHFAELEAEVEAEGHRKLSLLFPFGHSNNTEVRRERSLSQALAASRERCILVEGDPGSGKSVALRHVAKRMALKAMREHNRESVIPIYVNLKGLERDPDTKIDRNLIEEFIFKSLLRSNDSVIDDILHEEYAPGREEGTWLFLFDSFDELPEVLSSTEADTIILQYGNAIADFLEGGGNRCRGVIASRHFRGPKYSNWPHFRILDLSEKRRQQLIHRAGLAPRVERELIGRLGAASDEVRTWTSNPLFLALLCKHMRSNQPFPENVQEVFQAFIDDRLEHDRERLQKRYGFAPKDIRETAEQVAFCMTIDQGLGLGPTREKLRTAMARQNIQVPPQLDMLLNALEYVKLARADAGTPTNDERVFTFAHRRFQEYFATLVVVRYPVLVTPQQLLTDGRWRESAVVICQTQPVGRIQKLLTYGEDLLQSYCDTIPDLIPDPVEYLQQTNSKEEIKRFCWPANTLYLLELLQSGLANRLNEREISPTLRLLVGQIGLTATQTGTLGDRKWALEVAGIAPEPVFHHMLQNAFSGSSQWLKDVAYRQVARAQTIKPSVEKGIRLAIIGMHQAGKLKSERYATQTHIARLPQPVAGNISSIIKLLLSLSWINAVWHVVFFLAFAIVLLPYDHFVGRLGIVACIALVIYAFSERRIWNEEGNGFFLFLGYLITCLLFIPDYDYKTLLQLAAFHFPDILAHWQTYLGQLGSVASITIDPSLGKVLVDLLRHELIAPFLFLLLYQCWRFIPSSLTLASTVRKTNWIFYTFIPFFPGLTLFALPIITAFEELRRELRELRLAAYDAIISPQTWELKKDVFLKRLVVYGGGVMIGGCVLGIIVVIAISFARITLFAQMVFSPIGRFFSTTGWIFLLIGGIVLAILVLLGAIATIYGIIYGIVELIKLRRAGKLPVRLWLKTGFQELHAWLAEKLQQLLADLREWLELLRLRSEWEQRLHKQPVDCQSFMALMKAHSKNKPKLLEIVEYTRQHRHLIPSDEAEEELKELAFQIEIEAKLSTNDPRSTLLDELYRLIEDVHIQLPG